MFDVSCHVNRFHVFKISKADSLAPLEELADRLVVCQSGILVANLDGEEFEKSLGRLGTDVSNDRWNLK
jgi:hypothetical protein